MNDVAPAPGQDLRTRLLEAMASGLSLAGAALLPDRLEKLARYETHLDRKLPRLLATLLKLQEIRQTVAARPS